MLMRLTPWATFLRPLRGLTHYWTKLDSLEDYQALVDAGLKTTGHSSLAEWKLDEWKPDSDPN